MEDSVIYWIWLQYVLGYGSNRLNDVLLEYKNAKDFYETKVPLVEKSGCLTQKELHKFRSHNLEDAYKILGKCRYYNIDVITYDDLRYPKILKSIYNPPCVLYIKGVIPDLDENLAISIVGTRAATIESKKVTYDISYGLSKAGVVVVSGGAVGIDIEAHKGAIDAGGKTICVLGNGIDVGYPKENSSIIYNISSNGALISEFPPETPPLPRNFPVRNRIISALSLGTVIVQAGERSGALITANHALEQNRDVFVVPGDIENNLFVGSNSLIKDGAKLITSSLDIIDEYINVYPEKFDISINEHDKNIDAVESENSNTNGKVDINVKYDLSVNAKMVYNVLCEDRMHVDDILVKTGLSVSLLLQSLTELEVKGLIKSHSGKRYSRCY